MTVASTFVLACVSFLLTSATIGNAFLQKKQFYASVVYLTKSSPSMAVMYFQAMVIAYMIFQVARRIFFGQLRASETEHLSERTWHAVMETCLAFTVFRDDFSPRFVMQFVLLLFIRSFHWLSEDRVDFMERSPVITLLFHARIMSLLAFLSALDSYFVSHAYFTTLLKGASVQIVFGFEYAILMSVVLHVAIKYILHMHDLRSVHPWENKAVYLLYCELLINMLRCLLYVIFVGVMIRLHTFPLFSIRPLYLTVRAFHKAANDVILSRRAIHAMNHLFPLATEQDLAQGDNTCIICREEMTPVSGAKKLPCNHIFHSNCLRSWFQRQQSCPTCRTDILAPRRPTIATPQRGAPVAAEVPAAAAAGGQFRDGPPPNMFPFMAHHFGFPQPQPQNANNNNETAQPQNLNANSATNASGVSQTQLLFPNMSNGLPFMPPFMMMAPPLPFPVPPTFAGLSDAEVAAMEGRERAAVEARVTCLRNIGLLLDAATMQLQQYTSIVQSVSANTRQSEGNTSTVTESNQSEKDSQNVDLDMPSTSRISKSNDILTSASSTATVQKITTPVLPSTGDTDSQSNADVTKIRQRRLAKFLTEGSSGEEGRPQ